MFDCGQFCGGFDSSTPAVWERIDGWDLPDMHRCRCLDCATAYVQEQYDLKGEPEARHEVLAALSGDPA